MKLVMEPHEKRVMDEKSELDKKLGALGRFISYDPVYLKLDADEQSRLIRQRDIMAEYSKILFERINHFQIKE